MVAILYPHGAERGRLVAWRSASCPRSRARRGWRMESMQVEELSLGRPEKGADEKYCVECAAVIRARAEICPSCGVRQAGADIAQASAQPRANVGGRSRIAAALFAFFLGGFGAHKFYLGQGGKGVFYLLFFWTLIPGFIAFIEFIILLTMSDEAFDAKYNS